MRRSISKIPPITFSTAASFSTAGVRGRGFLTTDPIPDKPKVENQAKFVHFRVFSGRGLHSQIAWEKRQMFCSVPVREQLSNEEKATKLWNFDEKLPTSRKQVVQILREALEWVKPFFMSKKRRSKGRIKSHEEWEETVDATLNALTRMKEEKGLKNIVGQMHNIIKEAQMQQQTLADETIDTIVASSVKSLEELPESNSGWVFDEKNEFKHEFRDMLSWCVLYMYQSYRQRYQDM